MALPAARQQYLKTQIETASKEQLVVMLFDGIIRFTEQARKAIENKQIEDSHHALMRAQAIVMELICTLDKEKGGDVANNLMALHAYAFNCLIVCNMRKDLSKIDEVQNIYRKLREGWVGAMESLGLTSGGGPAAPEPDSAPTVTSSSKTVSIPKPQTGITGGNGVMASAAKPAPAPTPVTASAPAANAPAPAPVPVAVPAAPLAGGYGMGKTAYSAAPSIPPAQPSPAAGIPAAPKPAVPAAPSVKPGLNAKQAAMLSAYGAGARSIA